MEARRRLQRGFGAVAIIVTTVMAACGSPAASSPTLAPSTPSAAAPSPTSATASPALETPPAGEGSVVGLFDVGGHDLYIDCAGTGAPTIIYMHGSITNPSIVPHRNGLPIRRLLQDFRVCVYDRRNLPRSETVDAVQRPEDAIADLHGLLDAAGIEGPYVLLGASFGGLLAYLYANTYPDDVVGMVLLDSPFPDEMALEDLVPEEDRYEAFDEEDQNSLERISHFAAHQAAVPYIGQEPAIPMTYLASLQEPWDSSGIAAYDAKIKEALAAFVARFSPGTLLEVDSPHFMEPAIPSEIADAIRGVVAAVP